MSLTVDQRIKLELTFEGSREKPDALTDWETGFISSVEERYNEYKDDVLISERQWVFINKVYDKVVA